MARWNFQWNSACFKKLFTDVCNAAGDAEDTLLLQGDFICANMRHGEEKPLTNLVYAQLYPLLKLQFQDDGTLVNPVTFA